MVDYLDISMTGSAIRHAYVDGHVHGEYVPAVQNMIHERVTLLQAAALEHHYSGEHEAYEDAEYCAACQAKPWAGLLDSFRQQQLLLKSVNADETTGYWLQLGIRDAQYALEHWTGYPAHIDEPMPEGWTMAAEDERRLAAHDGRLRSRCPACQAVYGKLGRVCALQYIDMHYGRKPSKKAKNAPGKTAAE